MADIIEGLEPGNEELNEKLIEWLKWDKNETTHQQIHDLVLQKNWPELEKRLLVRLAFGTAGLRGKMQAGNNAMNDLVIIQTTQGLAEYILKCYPRDEDRRRGIVVGYDGRHNSKRFAQLAATIFINKNIPVCLYNTTVPTPFVSFCVKEKQCLAGVMVTASHNPKEDNGYKVYWTNSAQIISPHDKNIQNSILQNLTPLDSSWDISILETSDLVSNLLEEISTLYYNKLLSNIPTKFLDLNKKFRKQFVYTAMHGVGYPYVAQGIKLAGLPAIVPVEEQKDPHPDFPTVKFPNPEEGKSSLALSIKLANSTKSNVILANDPDADRFALAEKDSNGTWKVFNGNELGTLLGWWIMKCFQEDNPDGDLSQCYMLASTVSSKMLKSMGKIAGFNFEETLTGFKWMGNRTIELIELCNKTVLFAYEESIGYMISPTVLDKDGVSAAVHLATMASYVEQIEKMSLIEKLEDLYKIYGYHFSVTSYFLCYEPDTIVKIFERIRNWGNETGKYPDSIIEGKYKIAAVRDLTTGVDTSQPDGKAIMPSSKSSQMITFTFENGVVVTLRTSGTEPKIKYYAEMCAQPGNSDYEGLHDITNEMVDAIINDFLQPSVNNIIARTD